MKATLKIHGEIGVDVKLTDLISQMKKYPNPEEIEIEINSPGGFVSHANEIFDYLSSFQIPKTTIAVGFCASAATKLMLLGDPDKRKIVRNTKFMIHNPFAETSGDADFLKEFSSELKKIENEFVSFYAKELSQPEIAIRPLMNRETFLNENELLALGFASEIVEGSIKNDVAKYKAVAKLDYKPKTVNYMQLDQKSKKTLLEKIGAALNLTGVQAMLEIQDNEGNVLVFPDLEPEQMPSEGDSVTAEDGTYTINDQILIVEAGKVVEISEVEDMGGDEDVEQMKKDLAEAKEAMEDYKQKFESEVENRKKQESVSAKLKTELESVRDIVSDFEIPMKGQPKAGATEKKEIKSSLPKHEKGQIKSKLTSNK